MQMKTKASFFSRHALAAAKPYKANALLALSSTSKIPLKAPKLTQRMKISSAQYQCLSNTRSAPLTETQLVAALKRRVSEGETEAFFVVDLAVVLEKLEQWRALLPRVDPYYAVKCNPDRQLLTLLAENGVGFDCASKAEISEILSLGVSPQRILFANPCKPPAHLKFAHEQSVNISTFDSHSELEKTAHLAPGSDVLFRLRVDDAKAQCSLSNKYGASLEEAPDLLAFAIELGLNVRGVSFHVGSGCRDPSAFSGAVHNAKLVYEFANSRGIRMDVLDVGGGFPGVDTPELSFECIARVLRNSLDQYFPAQRGVRLLAEPGRFIAAASHTLAVNVIGKKHVASRPSVSANIDQAAQPHTMYYLNDGLYGSFNCLLYDHAKVTPQVLPSDDSYKIRAELCSLWGPTCDGFDCILPAAELSPLSVGDWLYFRNMGAYTSAAGSNFNGMPLPARVYRLASAGAQHQEVPTRCGEMEFGVAV